MNFTIIHRAKLQHLCLPTDKSLKAIGVRPPPCLVGSCGRDAQLIQITIEVFILKGHVEGFPSPAVQTSYTGEKVLHGIEDVLLALTLQNRVFCVMVVMNRTPFH